MKTILIKEREVYTYSVESTNNVCQIYDASNLWLVKHLQHYEKSDPIKTVSKPVKKKKAS